MFTPLGAPTILYNDTNSNIVQNWTDTNATGTSASSSLSSSLVGASLISLLQQFQCTTTMTTNSTTYTKQQQQQPLVVATPKGLLSINTQHNNNNNNHKNQNDHNDTYIPPPSIPFPPFPVNHSKAPYVHISTSTRPFPPTPSSSKQSSTLPYQTHYKNAYVSTLQRSGDFKVYAVTPTKDWKEGKNKKKRKGSDAEEEVRPKG